MLAYWQPGLEWMGDRLVGHWCPSFTGPTSTYAIDSSGRANIGALQNMDQNTAWLTSENKGSLVFDGTNDRIDFQMQSNPFSFEASVSMWVKLDVATPASQVQTGILSTSQSQQSHYPLTNGLGYFSTFRTSRVNAITLSSNVTRTSWHLLTITTTNLTWRLFQNNELVFSTSAESSVTFDPTYFIFGRSGPVGNNNFNFQGAMDDMRLYSRALAVNEVEQLYFQGRGGGMLYQPFRRRSAFVAAGFKAYWHRRQQQIIGGGLR